MNKFLILFVVVSFLIGCKTQEEIVELKLKKCVNSEIQNFRKLYANPVSKDIYSSLEEVENMFINKKFLQGRDIDSYKAFISDVQEDTGRQDALRKVLVENFNDQLLELIHDPTTILIQCPQTVLITEKNSINSTLNLQYETMGWLIAEGYKNKEAIDQLFSVTKAEDFNKIIYRTPFIFIILMNTNVLN